MTLYHRGENQVEFVPSCPTSRDPRLVPEDADLEERTRIVIVLSINRRDWQILVERWEEVPKRRPNRSTANYNCIPGLMQSLTLNADVEYDGPSLEILAEKLFDRLPRNIPGGEFLITPNKLNVFNTTMWEAFR
ncbi:unnamed protein product [Sphagnum troendelagicum]